jgi:hypothetical protein
MTKSKTISLRITEEQFKELYDRAIASNTVISQYIINTLFSQETNVPSTPIPKLLTIDRIIEVINEKIQKNILNFDSTYVLSDFLEPVEWGSYFNVIPIGKTFCQLAQREDSAVYDLVEWQGKENGPARYKIKKNML